MGERQRQRRSKDFKFKVALEAIRNEKQINEIAAQYFVHPNQVAEWKRQLLEKGPALFGTQAEKTKKEGQDKTDALYKTIGHQQVQIDWLKKKLGITE